jgi:hypothetical protein
MFSSGDCLFPLLAIPNTVSGDPPWPSAVRTWMEGEIQSPFAAGLISASAADATGRRE